jgi:4'-phosphopantetheinyl transferase
MTNYSRVPSTISGNSLRVYFAQSGIALCAGLEQEYLTLMPPGIRASVLRYKRWQDRQATLFGKLLLWKALRIQFHDEGLQKFRSLEVTRTGKPFITGRPEFSISHSGAMVVLVLAGSGAVGVDIEKIRKVNLDDFLHYLPEVAILRGQGDTDYINKVFFDCWTQKEAVLKGNGGGLSIPLDEVLIKKDMAFLHGTKWHMRKLLLDEGYCCYVATDQMPESVTVEYVNLPDGLL